MAKVEAPNLPKILWQHPDPKCTQMYKFKSFVEHKRTLDLPVDCQSSFIWHQAHIPQTFKALHTYSISRRADFWNDVYQYFPIIASGAPAYSVDESIPIDALPKWFPGLSLNFAENILYTADPNDRSKRTKLNKEDSRIAVVEVREGITSRREITWRQLRTRTFRFAAAMKSRGVMKGDRVALVAGNGLDTLCVFLGATKLGALFSSSSCDMGSQGILERLQQIKPKWVFVDDAAVYNGRTFEMREKMMEIVQGMDGVKNFKGIVSMPRFLGKPRDLTGLRSVVALDEFLNKGRGILPEDVNFERVGFQDGFLIVYSSGTTGPPKCIVHGVGGIVISAFKEFGLHRGLSHKSTVMQYTTTGWIMYLGSVLTLLSGAKLIMYDGSPFIPRVDTFIQLIAQERVTYFGTSPRYFQTLQSNNISPKKAADISSLEMVTSTGMVLPPALFAYFYSDDGFPSHTHLTNISGGTDIAGAFADGNSLDPVYATGGCQGPSLGIDLQVYDPSILEGLEGKALPDGGEGELVAVQAFPNTPIKFWGDPGDKKYHAAYYARFKHVWTHGDLVSYQPHTNAFMLHGRADGVLNPSGVRFGSAEIYGIVDTHFAKEVEDSVCIGQRRKEDKDVSTWTVQPFRSGTDPPLGTSPFICQDARRPCLHLAARRADQGSDKDVAKQTPCTGLHL